MYFTCPNCNEESTVPIGLLAVYFCTSDVLMCFKCGNVASIAAKDRWDYVTYIWRN